MKETLYSTFGPMLDVAASYFRRAYAPEDKIVYRSATGLYAENTCYTGEVPLKTGESVTVENAKALQCSEFAMAVCSGIPFELSRYVQEKNERLWWGFRTDGSVPVDYSHRIPGYLPEEDYLTAAEWAHYCSLKGWLIPFDLKHNALLPGDVLFWKRKTQNYSAVFQNVGHVAILLDRQGDSFTSIESGRTVLRRFDAEPTTLEAICRTWEGDPPDYWARLPFPVSRTEPQVLQMLFRISAGSGSGEETEMYRFLLPERLEPGFYSFNWEQRDRKAAVVRLTGENQAGETQVTEYPVAEGFYKHITLFADLPFREISLSVRGSGTWEIDRLTMHSGYYR